MDTKPKLHEEQQETLNRIESLLKGLTPDSLTLIEQFVRFVNQQAQVGQSVTIVAPESSGRPPYEYATIALPAGSLNGWLNLVPSGYDGDA